MALVGYSDSEESETDITQSTAPVAAPKRLERVDGKKIKVDLSSLSTASTDAPSEPAPKRQRTGGVFRGFNSLLPAPKRTTQSSVKPGINLRTSSEAAFSRRPPPRLEPTEQPDAQQDVPEGGATMTPVEEKPEDEPKLVGKTTRFLPLSVANAKKKKKRPPAAALVPESAKANPPLEDTVRATPKARQSLFSMNDTDEAALAASAEPYEPEFVQTSLAARDVAPQTEPVVPDQSAQGAGLNGVASDLNLSASERRRLFGRQGKDTDVKIAHFDMDAEYRSNQILAANGEAEQRTVRAIAPGRHSLQQLVNNVKGQTDALEDAWADGRRKRGETGNKYGW